MQLHTIGRAMSRRINMMVDDDTWELLSKVPSGERSRALNEALRERLEQRQREQAAADLAGIRRSAPRVASDELVRWVREDRENPARRVRPRRSSCRTRR